MEVYLNTVEMGPGIYGVESASERYFGISAQDLSSDQAGRLAAVLPDPLKWQVVRPGPYVRRRSGKIDARENTVARGGLAACVFAHDNVDSFLGSAMGEDDGAAHAPVHARSDATRAARAEAPDRFITPVETIYPPVRSELTPSDAPSVPGPPSVPPQPSAPPAATAAAPSAAPAPHPSGPEPADTNPHPPKG